jgi:hypothetical protein
MNHMPYEDTGLGILGVSQEEPKREAPTRREEPGRTPHSAEGPEHERKMPAGEPGRTPGSAEGEDPDRPPAPPRR